MTTEEIIEKYKKYLTKNQIKGLVDATDKYRQLHAKQRADAQAQLNQQYRSARRGLQNIGLASREGNVISGRESALKSAVDRSYGAYNRQLNRIEQAQVEQQAVRMANQTIRARQQQQEDELQKLTEQLQKAEEERRQQLKDELRGGRNGVLTETGGGVDYRLAEIDAQKKAIQKQINAQRKAQNAQYRGMTDTGGGADYRAIEAGYKQERNARNTLNMLRADMSNNWNRAQTDGGDFMQAVNDAYQNPVRRFFADNRQGYEAYRNLPSQQQSTINNALRQAYEDIDANVDRWNRDIAAANNYNGAAQQQNIPGYEKTTTLSGSFKEDEGREDSYDTYRARNRRPVHPMSQNNPVAYAAEKARRERAAAYSTIYLISAALDKGVDIDLLLDDNFDVRYDAAIRSIESKLKDIKRQKIGDSTGTFEMLENATLRDYANWETARMLRDAFSPDGVYWMTYSNANAGKYLPEGAQKVRGGSSHNALTEYYRVSGKPFMQDGWKPYTYDEEHGTERSKYAAIINDFSRMIDDPAWMYSWGKGTEFGDDLAKLNQAIGNFNFSNMSDTQREAYNKAVRTYSLTKGTMIAGDANNTARKQKVETAIACAYYMTADEIDTYNSILAEQGEQKADEYFEFLLPQLADRLTYEVNRNNEESATAALSDPVEAILTSLASVPVNLYQGVTQPIKTMFAQQNDPTAAKLEAMRSNTAGRFRQAMAAQMGNVGGFIYQTGMSAVDSATVAMISSGIGNLLQGAGMAANAATKAGEVIGGAILGGAAYNSAYDEALQRGLSPEKARVTAAGQGINEMLFETLSIGTLLEKTGKSAIQTGKGAFTDYIVNMLIQAGVEGSEEVFTDIANRIWDNRINGIYSEEIQTIQRYISEGMSPDEAKKKAFWEYAGQLGLSFLGGAISGGVMAGVGQGINNIKQGYGAFGQNNPYYQSVRDAKHFDKAMRDTLDTFEFKNDKAQEIQKKGKKSNQDYALLYDTMRAELYDQYKGNVEQAVEDGVISKEDAKLIEKWQQNGVQSVDKDGNVVGNENGITADEFAVVVDALEKVDVKPLLDISSADERLNLNKAVGAETADVIRRAETTEQDAEEKYRQTVREINNDTTLSPELKQKRLEAAERTRQNARSEASKIADTALTNKKGIGAKLETDGNGTVKVSKGSGKVTYDFSTKDNPGHQTVDSMTATEQSALRLAKIVAASRPDVNVKVEAEFGVDENGVDHSKENGYYNPKTNTIHINMSGDNSVLWTLSHELTHHLANTDTKAYAALRTAIETALKDSKLTTTELEERGFEYDLDRVDPYIAKEGNLWKALVAFEREEHGYGKDAEEEVVARCCESFLGFNQFVKDFAHKQYKSAKAVNKFIAQMNIDMQRVSEDARQSAAQRKVWNDESPENQILRQLTEIDKIAKLWRIAVNAEAKKRQESKRTARENTVEQTNGNRLDNVRASTKDSVKLSGKELYDYSRTWEQQVQDWIDGKIPARDTLVMGATPDVLRRIGFTALPMLVDQTHIGYWINHTYTDSNGKHRTNHDFTQDEVNQLPDKIAHPIAIIASNSSEKGVREKSVVVYIEMQNKGRQVIVPVQLSFIGTQNGEAIDATLSASAYGKKSSVEDLKQALEMELNGGHEVFYVNKNAIGLASASTDLTAIKALIGKIHSSDGFVRSITDKDSPVKIIPKKPTETKQFERFFGDSKARNSDGSPMVVYHGTDADFDVFDYANHGGKNGSALGYGIYLATTQGLAERYGDRLISAYVRIENPASTTEKKYTYAMTRRLVKALCEYDAKKVLDDYDGDMQSALKDTWVSNYVNTYEAASMEQVYSQAARKIFDNNTNDSDIINEIMIADGLHNDKGAAEFYKNVLTPTTGTDGFVSNSQGETVYVAFDSSQIKSTDNIGLFDRNNPNIRYSRMDKVRLSTADGTRTYTLGDVTAKLYGNDVELDGGKVRQRVSMMEAIAEINGTARVDAASEEEAEAFRRAGAEQVTEELEGHGAKYGTWEFKYEERKFTNDSRYDIKQKQKFAKSILKQVGKSSGFTQAQRVKYGAALSRLMDYLWEMQYGKMDGKVVFDFADRLFDSILNDYTALSEADEEFRSELLANMTKTKNAKGSTVYVLEVNDKQMREIKYAYENAMAYASKLSKALGARVTVKQTENAKTLEDIFTNSTDTRIKSDTNEGDMPGELLRIAQETESRKTNPYAAESDERQALKMGMFEAAMSAAGVEKSTAQQIREAVKETRKAERTKAKTEAKKAIDRARLAERMHEGALRAKDRRISENRERALKQHAAEREAKLKQGFRETTQKANETRLKRDMRTIALKWNQRLVKLLANPTEASHVPIQLAREVAELTKTITEYLDSGTERGRINLDKVIKAYQRSFADEETIAKAKAEDPHFDPRGLLPLHYDLNGNVIKEDPLLDMMNELNEIVASKSFKDLSAYEMKSLLDIVRGVAHTVYDANRMIGTSERRAIWEVGDSMIHQFEDAPDVKLKGYLETSLDLRRLARIFSGSNDNAEFVKLVERLNEGAIEKERIAQVLQDIFAPVTEKYGDEIRKWYGKKAEWIDTGITQNGKKVEITKGMRVSLAMHVLNAGNMRHIENGGITIPNREMYNKGKMADAYANGELVRLNAEQINEIISHMTDAEKAYVETAKEFFHKRTGYYVNKTSLQLLGYRKATVKNYFPIHTDKNFTKTDFASLLINGSIEGQGFLLERVMASNPIYLEDITSVVNRQIRGVALYAGLAVPMRNFNAVMNSTEYFEDANGAWRPRTTVRKAMTQKMGEYGTKVVKGFLEDASEMTHVDVSPMERFAGKLATNYVQAVLLGNLKVALKQVASYPTAAAVIPWKYLGKALLKGGRSGRMISRADVDLINQYTPLYQMRREGNANEIASIMAKRGMEQKLPWLLGWITKMDVMTVGRLWSAAEYMVADQQNLPVGSDEYYKAVAKVFNDTIQQTQPNFTPLQRNAALRSKNPIVRSLGLFGTQRMQNGGILTEATMELAQSKGKSKEEIKAARQKLGRAVASQIVQNILLIAAELGKDFLLGRMLLWQDDDEKKITDESLLKVMGDKFLSNMMGSFLGGSEIYNLVSALFKKATGGTAYDTEFTVPALDAAETILNFVEDLPDVIKYLTGDHTDEEKLKKAKNWSMQIAKAFGYATGIPLENAVKDLFKGIIPAIKDHVDYFKTGEFPQWWLHQSGKLDNAKTAANYKEWTNLGKKGSVYLSWEKKLKETGSYTDEEGDEVKQRTARAEELRKDNSLTNDERAMLLRMVTTGATSDGSVVYNENGKIIVDFTNEWRYKASLYTKRDSIAEALWRDTTASPEEKAKLLSLMADGEFDVDGAVVYTMTKNDEGEMERNSVVVDFTNLDRYRASTMLSDKRYEGFLNLVDMGVAEDIASTAFIQYNVQKKQGAKANDRFRDWLFTIVKNPEDRAKVDMAVIGNTVRAEGTIGYKENGEVYADYSSKEMFDLYTSGTKQEKSDAIIATTDTPEAKAKAFADTDNNYHAKGGIVYNDKDKVVADFTSDEAYRASQMGESSYEKYNDAVKYGMTKENAILAVEKHKEFTDDDDKDNATQYATWVFNTYKDAKDRAIAGAIYTTKPVTVKDGRTYDENGYIYRDYTSAAWYKLSNRTLSKDGVNKRYEAAKRLEKDGYTAEKTVAAYVELDKLSKKSEWKSWLKDHGYTDDQIEIILWSRGWAKLD